MPDQIDYAALAKQVGAVSSIAPTTQTSAAPAVPPGNERTRVDTNVIGVNHDQLLQGIANWASKLPEPYRKPAAILATLPADALASLAEMFSAPETVATVGRAPIDAAAQAVRGPVGSAVSAAGKGLERVGEVTQRPAMYVSAYHALTNPGRAAVEVAAPYAARKVGAGLQSVGEAISGAPTQVGGVSLEALRAAGVGEPAIQAMLAKEATPAAEAATSMPTKLTLVPKSYPVVAQELRAAVPRDVPKLTAEEVAQGFQMMRQGASADDVLKSLLLTRLQLSGPFAGLPSDAEVGAVVAAKNAKTTPFYGGTKK